MASNITGYEWPVNNTKHIVYVTGDDHIHMLVEKGKRWIDTDITKNANAPTIPLDNAIMTGYAWHAGLTQQIDYVSPDDNAGHIRELVQREGSDWSYEDLMLQPSGAAPADGTAIAGFSWQGNDTKHIVYTSAEGHIHELMAGTVGVWQYTNITEQAAAPTMEGFNLATYVWEGNNTRHVAYISKDGHVHELMAGKDSAWQDTDVTEKTNMPVAGDDSPIVGYAWDTQNMRSLVYTTTQGQIYILTTGNNGDWQGTDLTELTQAPTSYGSALTGFVWSTGGMQEIAYLSENGHVQELSAGTDGKWNHLDITEAINTPLAQNDSLIGFEWTSAFAKQIVYIGDTESPHIHELMLKHGSGWKHTDVTTLTGASDLV